MPAAPPESRVILNGITAFERRTATRVKKAGSLETLAVVGIDIGNDTIHLVGFDCGGQLVLRQQIPRQALTPAFAAPENWTV